MHMGLEVKVIGLQGRSYVFVIKTLYKPINADACHVAASKTKKNILITLQVRKICPAQLSVVTLGLLFFRTASFCSCSLWQRRSSLRLITYLSTCNVTDSRAPASYYV